MEELKKEVADLKVLVSNLLEVEVKKFNLQYGWIDKPLENSTKK